MKHVVLVAVAAFALALVPAGMASPPGTLVKAATGSGQPAAASLFANVTQPRVVYGSATGSVDSVSFVVACSRGSTITPSSLDRTSAGTWRLPIPARAERCAVVASVGGNGTVHVEIRVVR